MDDIATLGRRERKKLETRRALAAAAERLFLERGYDAVTVADVAAEADTAVTTLFKHFPAGKSGLLFWDDGERADALVAAVRERPAGTSPLGALRQFMTSRGVFDVAPSEDERRVIELVLSTPELWGRAREMWVACEGPVAQVLAEVAGGPGRDGGPGGTPDAATRALARIVLEVPDVASRDPEPLAALHAIFDRLEEGWPAYAV
ncbi:TetR/AcrR family transcriptional regulator [Cellulomonas sp. PhB143]|uniref:TetR/AcrR family transcriptional regulator n=1 Tax=Cellulomonas sp. PhB143 TaxID=2485186 RepID=UPI000F47BD8A|nr:helix-turn-helix domain-containing protein [Cellulomonas sp. PhB143]ROS75333.1 TetR family transcriptional regulator [Cellulomonas sp. PhB143]